MFKSRLLALGAALALSAGLVGVSAPDAQALVLTSTTTVSPSAPVALVGTPVTLTATVKPQPLGGLILTPTGNVSFTASVGETTVNLGTVALKGPCVLTLTTCTATLTTSALPAGSAVVRSTYAGDLLSKASSGVTQVLVITDPVIPAEPTLTATNLVGGVRLAWSTTFDGGSPVTAFRLYRSPTGAIGSFTQIASVPTGNYQETTIPIGSPFFYKATAVNAVGESGFSNQVSGQAQARGGAESFETTACDPGSQCWSADSSASSVDGTTTVSANTTSSTGAHTLTTAVGGPALVNCSTPYRGFTATFNDTSTDAYKNVDVTLTGADATAMLNDPAGYDNGAKTGKIGCLGLGTTWKTGPGSFDDATWSATDGLYVGTPDYCSAMGAFQTGISPVPTYSEPCVDVSFYYSEGSGAQLYFTMTFRLPPGDGRLSGNKP